MRFAFDTEFNCTDNKTIDLISIALVSDTGLEYYAVSTEFDLARCDEWLHQNVLIQLPKIDSGSLIGAPGGFRSPNPNRKWKPRGEIANDIRCLLTSQSTAPELWAYFASFDFVAFCELFGGMMRLPTGVPQYVMDLRQRMTDLGVKKSDLPSQKNGLHDALEDARWNMECLKFLDNKFPEFGAK